jgi:polyisoprenyl-teichoic acid--peptidoglycan teichoic acid transferase
MNNQAKSQPTSTASSIRCGCGCLPVILAAVVFGLLTALYFFSPGRTNILLLGIDKTPAGSDAGRSDTNILTTIIPSQPYIGMLSIPRDLWVEIPGIGQNRINTAHFFAEAALPGSGPKAALQAVRENFGIDVGYYFRVKFNGFEDVIDAMGGVDLVLPNPTAGYPAGMHHLNGSKALAFARNRTGTDDFFRMAQGQLVRKSVFSQLLSPLKWFRLPAVLVAAARSIDTNLPIWLWPRLGFTLLRMGPGRIDSRSIFREMVTPTITDQGADVLLPNWEQINPLLLEMFGQ